MLDKIGIIILAAGGSSRLGSSKQLLRDRNGETLIRRICKLALSAHCKNVFCILGANHEVIDSELQDLNVTIAINPAWATGLASSIKAGLEIFNQQHPALEAAIFLVCDQPFVTIELINEIIHQFSTSGKSIIASHYQGIAGTPALFDRSMLPALMNLEGDRGAGKVIKEQMQNVALVQFQEGAFDIDTLKDYELFVR